MYFFDLDGTLLDSNGVWLDIDVEFLGRFGIGSVPEDYTDYVTHHGFDDSARYTRDYFRLPLTPEEIISAWREMARSAYAGQLELKPGARGFLERARVSGIPRALLTSCIPSLCSAALEHHRLLPLLDRVFTAAELGLEKRDPELYRLVARLCRLEAGDCVLFDDSPVYCRAAREAGWQVYGVSDPVFDDRAEEMREVCGPGRFPFDLRSPLPLHL